jgi:hypothetical protein
VLLHVKETKGNKEEALCIGRFPVWNRKPVAILTIHVAMVTMEDHSTLFIESVECSSLQRRTTEPRTYSPEYE